MFDFFGIKPRREDYAAAAAALSEGAAPVQSQVFGHSMLSEELTVFRLGEGHRRILLVGTHHGTEWLCTGLLFRFLHDLCHGYTMRQTCGGIDLRFLLSRTTFFVVPTVNPDGARMACFGEPLPPLEKRQIGMNGGAGFLTWQAKARGVDLNHNYDYAHAAYKELERALPVGAGKALYAGEFPESEPETHALAGLVRSLAPSAVLSLHLGGDVLYSAPDTPAVGRMADRLSTALSCRRIRATGTDAYGGFCDYTGYTLGIPSFTPVLGKGENPPPVTAADMLYARLWPSLVRFSASF